MSHHDWGIDGETWAGGTPDDDWCAECKCPIGQGSCAGCCAVAATCEYDGFPDEDIQRCPECGKEYEDFSDLGCARCDQRHPGFETPAKE